MLRSGQKLGKYRIRRRLARGGFGDVYEAHDTIEGIGVALKIPRGPVDDETLSDFRREARLAARLEHPNVLPLKNADIIDGTFVIAYPLGDGTLHDRLGRRMSLRAILDFAEQVLAALAHAHEHRIIHCDIKPENLILFDEDLLRLTDFGIAKVAMRTVVGSASGSLGYMAPEQAMGRPSARSDVFSAGLLIYQMLTGELPEWPFEWPPPGFSRVRRHSPELVAFLRRALEVDARRRFRDAAHMYTAFRRIKNKAINYAARRRNGKRNGTGQTRRDWREIRLRQFKKRFGRALKLDHECAGCHQPLDERMRACPWCGTSPVEAVGESSFPAECPRCHRGVKLDWHYCAWCYGAKIGPIAKRTFSDRRYAGRCSNTSCKRRVLMPFSKYCPWCRAKVTKVWSLAGSTEKCGRCDQRIARGFWPFCAWCGADATS